MQTLDKKPVIVVSPRGTVISIGRFAFTPGFGDTHPAILEVAFETPTVACRLRINPEKVETIKKSWDGNLYRYQLPGGWYGFDDPSEKTGKAD